MNLEFSRQIFEKKTQISNFMKIRPLAAVPCGGTDTRLTKPIVAFRTFANTPEIEDFCPDSTRRAGGTSMDRTPPPHISPPLHFPVFVLHSNVPVNARIGSDNRMATIARTKISL